jgi:hypothetical protein
MTDKDKLAKYRTEIQQVSSIYLPVHTRQFLCVFPVLET